MISRRRLLVGLAAAAAVAAVPVAKSPPETGTIFPAEFDADLGVFDLHTELAFLRVSERPQAGQYAVDENLGIYTFSQADAGRAIRVFWAWKRDPASPGWVGNLGETLAWLPPASTTFRLTRGPWGAAPLFRMGSG